MDFRTPSLAGRLVPDPAAPSGRRKGAGRPATSRKPRTNVQRMFSLPTETVEALDKLPRGTQQPIRQSMPQRGARDMLTICILLILYVFSFFWFKKTPWKRWLLWAAAVFVMSGGGVSNPEYTGTLIGYLVLWQAVRWAFIGIALLFRKFGW